MNCQLNNASTNVLGLNSAISSGFSMLTFVLPVCCGIQQFYLLQDEAVPAARGFCFESDVVPALTEIA
jgi:hypothetical protein